MIDTVVASFRYTLRNGMRFKGGRDQHPDGPCETASARATGWSGQTCTWAYLTGIAAVGPAWQSMRGGTIDTRIELDLRLRRRAEGGLAIAGSGEAFGMAVRGPRARTLVIPTTTVNHVAIQLLEHGRVPISYLGVGLRDVLLDDGGHGAMVMTLDGDGPAAQAGLHQGDIILLWAGHRMPHVGALLRTLRATPVGSEVPLALRRGGVPIEVTVIIGDRPER